MQLSKLRSVYVLFCIGVVVLSSHARGQGKGAGGGPSLYPPIPPAQFWTNFVQIGSFVSDGINPVQITIPGNYIMKELLDEPLDPDPTKNPTIAPGIKGPGVMVYPAGTVPPFANSVPLSSIVSGGQIVMTNNSQAWNPAIAAGVAGPYWPAEFTRTPTGAAANEITVIGHVTVKVLPAGSYDVWAQFGLDSVGANFGANIRYPYILLAGSTSSTGSLPTPAPGNPAPTYSTPTVTISVPADLAVAGTGTNGKLRITRVGGDTSQPLSVVVEAGVPADTLTATAFPGVDYSMTYANSGTAILPNGSTGQFTVVIPAQALSVDIIVKGTLVTPPPATPTRPAVFKLVDSPTYTVKF